MASRPAGTRATVISGRIARGAPAGSDLGDLSPAITIGVKSPDANMRGVSLKTSNETRAPPPRVNKAALHHLTMRCLSICALQKGVRNAAPGQRWVVRSTDDFVQPGAES